MQFYSLLSQFQGTSGFAVFMFNETLLNIVFEHFAAKRSLEERTQRENNLKTF